MQEQKSHHTVIVLANGHTRHCIEERQVSPSNLLPRGRTENLGAGGAALEEKKKNAATFPSSQEAGTENA